ncbi:MAG TPA: PilZ domain-containing protein [Candidatus Aquilonibacter sp.]|nr:PilZ domain-containing protein [Candidatus Aquilonibacter sp.]
MNGVSIEPTEISAAGIRRSGRISKEIPIVFSGADVGGRAFSEETKTLVLSLHGASVICHHKLIPEQEAYLRVIANNREIEVRICGQIGEREDGYIYGVAFADPDVDFWKIEFPPAEALPKDLVPVTLECSGCHRQVDLQFDATEMDVYTVNEGALRYCSQCGVSTMWRIAAKRIAAKVQPASTKMGSASQVTPGPAPGERQLALEPVAPISAPSPPNRRSERRTKVKFNACIRVSGRSDDVAPCEDMSRGGFSFHSSREYSVETLIEAAVPYTPGGMSIFVPAQIANVTRLQNGRLFRYGVAYIRSPKK